MRHGMIADEVRALPVSVDVPTAARVLGIGRSTAYRMACVGELPGVVRYGGTYRVRTIELAAHVGIGYDGGEDSPAGPPEPRVGGTGEADLVLARVIETLAAAGLVGHRMGRAGAA